MSVAAPIFEFTSRYGPGGPPEDGCPECDAMGCYPVSNPDFNPGPIYSVGRPDAADLERWWSEHRRNCSLRGTLRNLWRHKERWYWRSIWRDLRAARSFDLCRADNGYHFVRCPVCNGSRIRSSA